MEHSQANIDALRNDNEEADSRMFVHVSHAMELYSLGGVVIWNIVKLTFFTLALNILILSIFYFSMVLSTNYFAHFRWC